MRGYLKRCRRNLDSARALGDLQVGGHVFALSVDNHEFVNIGGHAVGHTSCRRVRDSALDGVTLGQAGNGHVDTMSLAVIGSVIATGSGNNLIGGLGHRKGAELLRDGVVALLGGIARSSPIDGIGIGAGADLGLGTGSLEVGGLAIDEAGDRALGGQSVTIVSLRVAGRSNSQRSRGNLVRTGHSARVVTLAGHRNGHGAHVGHVLREGQVVVGTFDQGLLTVLDLGLLRLFGAAVYNVRQSANRHTGSSNALAGNGQGTVVLRLDVVVGFLSSTPLDAHDFVGGGANLGLGTFGLGSRFLVAHETLNFATRGERLAVVDLAVAVGINRERSRRNLVSFGCGAGVVTDASNGNGDGLGVDEVTRVIGNRVIGTLYQGIALGILDLRGPLMFLAVINGIGRIANSSTRVALGVIGIGHDGLSRHLEGTELVGQNIVVVRSTFLELVRDGVFALANRSLGASRMNLAVAGEVGPNEASVGTVRTHVDPILSKGGAVIDLGRARGGQLNVAFINSEGLLGVLVAAVVISGGANFNRHRTGVNCRNHGRIAAPFGVRRTLNAVLKAHISAVDGSGRSGSGVRLSVVSVFDIVRRDGKTVLRRERSDEELALVHGDGVVVRLEVDAPVVNDGIGNLALGNRSHRAGSADVGDLALNKAVARNSDIRLGKSRAIVRLRVCLTFESHRALQDLVGHINAAGVVALTGNGHGNGTSVGSVGAIGKRVVNTLGQGLLAIFDKRLLLLRLAVVRDVRRSLNTHVLAGHNTLGRDGELTVDDHERNLREVLVVVGEVAGLELHVIGADVGALNSVVAAEGEVGFLVQLVRGLEVITRGRLLVAVVLEAIALLGDGDDDLSVISGDDELAVLGLYPIIGPVRALVKGISEGVVALARLGLGSSDVEGDTLTVNKANTFAFRGCGDGLVDKRLAVIRLGVVRGGQSHETRGDRDALGAGSVLALCVVRAGGTQLHGLETKVGNRDLGRIARPRLAINAVLDVQCVAVLIGRGCGVSGKRGALINLLVIVRVPHNTILVDFAALNLEPAILNHKLDVGEVIADVSELLLNKVHVVGTNSSALGGSVARELNVALSVEAVIGREVIASYELLRAIVGLRFLRALDGDGDLIGNRVHRQSAVLRLRENVVICARVGVERVGVGVILLTNVGDGASVVKGRALTLGKAGHVLHLVLGVLVAVVGPLVRSRLHGNGGLVDDERTVLGRDLKLARHIVALGIGHLGGTGDVVGVGTRVELGRVLGGEAGDGIRVALDRELIGLEALSRVLLTIVGSLVGVSLDRNLVLSVTVGDGQRARDGVDAVVFGLGVLVQFVAKDIGARANNSLRTRKGISRALTLGEAGLGLKRSLSVDKRRSVVGLGEVGRLQGHVSLGNVNVAVGHDKADVSEVGCICIGELTGQAHLGLAGIGTGSLRCTGEAHLVLGEEVVGGVEVVALSLVLVAVVLASRGLTNNGNRDRVADGLNGQSALNLSNDVVSVLALGRAAGEFISEGVVARAGVGLGTGHMSREALALRKAVTRDGNVAVGERGAVVGLLIGSGSQRDLTRGNGHRTVFDDLKGNV